VISTLCQSINEIGVFCISSYGIYLYSIDKLSLLSLITYNSLLSYFIEPIKNIINYIPNLYQIKLSYIKSNEFLSIEQENMGEIEKFSNGDIKYSNISYSYNDYNKVLNNVNITFKKNNHYILKGTTGSGKSTLLRMLNHNINDYEGNITINNINIKDYSLSTLRKNILYVSQNETLFSDTIYNNIVLNNEVSKEELNRIMKITKVDELIKKKSLRLESMLYDNGFNISGGEKQRIILARSLISKPNILILDESLSETDKKTEKYILDEIDKNFKDMTIIYITHTPNNSFKNIIKITNNL
jgi:ABC-type bacteriocin/lantibiotic exporter with double-glycine peptidase domain